MLPNISGSRFGDGMLEGTVPPRRSHDQIFLDSQVSSKGDIFLDSEVSRSHGENFLGSEAGKSSSVKAEPESFEGVSESGLV